MPNKPIHNGDGVDRRGFLKCMAWAGTGMVWTVGRGVSPVREPSVRRGPARRRLQLRPDQRQPHRLQQARQPRCHRHPAKADRQDQRPAAHARLHHPHWRPHAIFPSRRSSTRSTQVLKAAKHEADLLRSRRTRRPRATTASNISIATARARREHGWYSFDHKGVHFVGLVNVVDLKAGRSRECSARDQLAWLEDDLASLSSSTPIVVFAHIPLWAVYPEWGWGTDDSAQALGC